MRWIRRGGFAALALGCCALEAVEGLLGPTVLPGAVVRVAGGTAGRADLLPAPGLLWPLLAKRRWSRIQSFEISVSVSTHSLAWTSSAGFWKAKRCEAPGWGSITVGGRSLAPWIRHGRWSLNIQWLAFEGRSRRKSFNLNTSGLIDFESEKVRFLEIKDSGGDRARWRWFQSPCRNNSIADARIL